MVIAVCVVAVGWVASVVTGWLFTAFLDLLFVIDVKVNPRAKTRIAIHSVLLAEWLRRIEENQTGE